MTNLFNLRRFFLFVAVMLVCGSAGAVESKTIDSNIWDLNGFTIGNVYNITFQGSSFSANSWELFGLPFDASKDVLDHAFGAGNYRLSEYKELNGTTLIFSPMENPSVVAGKPYMIKVISDVISPQFLNVTMKYTTEQQTIANAKIKIVLPFLSKALWNFNNHYVYFVNAGSTAKVGYGTGELQKDLVAPKGYIETDGTVAACALALYLTYCAALVSGIFMLADFVAQLDELFYRPVPVVHVIILAMVAQLV